MRDKANSLKFFTPRVSKQNTEFLGTFHVAKIDSHFELSEVSPEMLKQDILRIIASYLGLENISVSGDIVWWKCEGTLQ